MISKPIIIAGPCSAENDEQMDIAIREAASRNIDFLRTNLWKPCDKPSWDGLKEKGLYLLSKVVQAGLNPALEVMFPDHVTMALNATLPYFKPDGKLLIWLGALNQNHFLQREVARIAAQDPHIYLMINNPPWTNDFHWEGIVDHVLDVGFPKERLLNCYRGIALSPSDDNPLGLRNLVNFDSAMQMKQRTGIPMLFDPSHTGGTVENVLKMGELSLSYDFDGITFEVHHDPTHALTDSKQQITWGQFDDFEHLANLYPENRS